MDFGKEKNESGEDRSPEYDTVYGRPNAVPAWMGPMAELMFHYWRMDWDIESIFQSNRFRVKDLLFCCIYAQNLDSMSRLHSAVGNEVESDFFEEKALETEQAILRQMYFSGHAQKYSNIAVLPAVQPAERKFSEVNHAWLYVFNASAKVFYPEPVTGDVIYGRLANGSTNPKAIPSINWISNQPKFYCRLLPGQAHQQ